MKMKPEQLELIRKQLKRLMAIEDGFYAKKLQGIDVDSIDSQEAFEKLPYSDKNDLRDAYPLGLQAVPEEEVVRIHSSSGTTGTPTSAMVCLAVALSPILRIMSGEGPMNLIW